MRQALIDPASGSGVRDWNRACELVRDMELPKPPAEQTQRPQTSIDEAIAAFRALKKKRSPDVQRKAKLLTSRLKAFLETRHKSTMPEITLPDLIAFRNTWTDMNSTQRRNQEILRSFFNFCLKAKYITDNPARDLDPIPEDRPKTDPFEPDEMQRIFDALPRLPDEYGRMGTRIAKQTKAFVFVMRYTGLSVGDTAKLEKLHAQGCRIRTHRKKTGEEVFAKVPQFVLDALNDESIHDSVQYYFWSGEGKMHTRSSKWGQRLQRLFVLANVKTREVEKIRRSGGKLKGEPELVKISEATPHMFRHTFARDWLVSGKPMEELAELLGNSLRTVEKYYSKWDTRRQAKLEQNLEDLWNNDPITLALKTSAESLP